MNKQEVINQIRVGMIFIYPTDTVYGLGCDASNKEAVNKLKQLKLREREKPLSIIAPSKEWIKEHCIVDVRLDKYLPGPYTLILKKKDRNFLNQVSPTESLGVRIPDCRFTRIIQEAGKPFITTSVNLSGEKPAVSLDEVSEYIKKQVDVVIPAQEKLSGKPSSLVVNGQEVGR